MGRQTGVRAPRSTAAARRRAAVLAAAGLSAALSACSLPGVRDPGTLVPPTADQDPALPRLAVTVAGRERKLHLQTFGDPAAPAALVLPGGPGEDFRLLLPLQALADRYFVVMWDPRGAGLSERVGAGELTLDSLNEEIAAVHAALAPGRPVTLIGHSFGGLRALRYAATHPAAVAQLALIEPGPFTAAGRKSYRGGSLEFPAVEDFFWQSELLTSSDHAAADYKAIHLLPESARSFTCSGEVPREYPQWRFGAFHHHVLTHTANAAGGGFNWAAGIQGFAPEVLLVAGTCGAAGEPFQRAYNLVELSRVRLTVIPGAGHISLFTDYAAQTLAALRGYLAAYQ